MTMAAIQLSVGRVANSPPVDTGRTSERSAATASRLRLQRLKRTCWPAISTGQRSLLRLAVSGSGALAPGAQAQIWVARRLWSRPRSGSRLEAKAKPLGPRSAGSTSS